MTSYWRTKVLKVLILSFLILFFSVGLNAQKFENRRMNMVAVQIESRGITDEKILKAFRTVERHKFVDPEFLALAYNDSPLPIDEGQTISQPYVVAFMTESLDLDPKDKVLEIGTGSGYQAAILAELCDSVFTIEIFESLARKAKNLFNDLGYKNIIPKTGDGYKGWPEYAPFDAIIVTCSPTHIPEPLKEQLAEGGRMIIPVGKSYTQQLVLLEKKKGKIKEKKILPVRFVPMLDEAGRKY
ncbi:protein-L-isoaspartate(D-aspartate) O-methyltransferase [Maribellus maritimus]|nr:protein-L-isoaspartate(D-aspartate) O-methyltransferase [Maribellus maritimus]